MEQHPFAVDRTDLQTDHLSDAQARRVAVRQPDAVAEPRNRCQETPNLLTIENRRQLLRLLAINNPLERFLLAKRDAVKEAQCARHLIDMRPGILLLHQMKL